MAKVSSILLAIYILAVSVLLWDKLTTTQACTTMVVGKAASLDGSPMVTHNNDCLDCDFRLSKVPGRTHRKGDVRDIYVYRNKYPSKVVEDRGDTWKKENLVDLPQRKMWNYEPMGSIPQVARTYGLIESGYGIMNEVGVAIGESTCAARFGSLPVSEGGYALFAIDTLTAIGLERGSTAREAIQIIGDLATNYGFYVEDYNDEDLRGSGGEALAVIDKNEAWVFHVACDDTGKSAVWVAQRVPDDHFAIVANGFIIREVDPKSPDFMYSDNLWEVAKRNGLWKESDGLLDFTKAFVYIPEFAPEIASPYTTLRQWTLLRRANPDLDIPMITDPIGSDYPFSTRPNRLLTPRDLMMFSRDQFEGTPHDLTMGVASGAHGNPDRWDGTLVPGVDWDQLRLGAFARGTSIHRTVYSLVAVSRSHVSPIAAPVVWLAHHSPAMTIFTPFYVATEQMPLPYTVGSHFKYEHRSSWWAGVRISNYGKHVYLPAKKFVHKYQDKIELGAAKEMQRLEREIDGMNDEKARKVLTRYTVAQGESTVAAMNDLFDTIVTYIHDGGFLHNQSAPDIRLFHIFYPRYWLDAAGYFEPPKNNPLPASLHMKPPTSPSGIKLQKHMSIDEWTPEVESIRYNGAVISASDAFNIYEVTAENSAKGQHAVFAKISNNLTPLSAQAGSPVHVFTVVVTLVGLVMAFLGGVVYGQRRGRRDYVSLP